MYQHLKDIIDKEATQSSDPRYGWSIEGFKYPKLKYWENEFEHLKSISLLSPQSLHFIRSMVEATNHLDGCCVEFGTYKGASASVISNATKRDLYCFDTFKGLKGKGDKDRLDEGDFADTSLEIAKRSAPKANFIVGDLPQTLYEFGPASITFAHIDLDYEHVTGNVLNHLLQYMQKGVIVIDDYGNSMCPGVKFAVDFLTTRHRIVATPLQTGQAFIILGV